MCETPDGTFWVGTGDGLDKFNRNDGTFDHYKNNPKDKNSLSSNTIQHMVVDKDGIIWIATREGGLNRFDPKTEQFIHYKNNPNDPTTISDNKVEYIFIDSYNQLWIGTYEGGLNKFDSKTGKFIQYKHNPNNRESISSNRIEYIFEDRSKVLWIATRGGGINKLDLKPAKFKNLVNNPNNTNSLPPFSVMAIKSDNKGNLWIGTDGGGLSKYNFETKTFTHFHHNPKNTNSLSDNRVWSIYIDKQGVIWAGTYVGGLNRVENVNGVYTFNSYKKDSRKFDKISSNQINSILEDSKGNIWIGTANGLNKLVKTDNPANYTFKSFFQNQSDNNLIVDNYVGYLYLDKGGRIWIAAYYSGLFEFDPVNEKFISYSPEGLKSSEFISNIHALTVFEDHLNRLWIGTESNGLVMFDKETKSFIPHQINETFLGSMIVGMLEDDMSNLWISTSRGIIKYSPWNNSINKYTFTDQLESGGFNRNSLHKSVDGTMYFGSNAALSYFYPFDVTNNPYIPPVVITDFKIQNKSNWNDNLLSQYMLSDFEGELILSHNDYFFTIEFSALDYTTPSENEYKYMLEGFSDEWVDATQLRMATFTNLDPGEYTFKVKGCNNDKIWNEKPTELKIRIIPPFWKRTWFYILESILGVFIIWYIIRFRTQSLVREKKSLEEKVIERTKEINSQKEELSSQAENLEIINKQLEDHQNHLEQLVKQRTEDLEIAKNKAEESDRLKSAFLANMTHEIRTPMNAIIGFSNLLDSADTEGINKEELIQLIIKNSNALLNLIDDIIDIAKIEAEQLKIVEKECNIQSVFADLIDKFSEINMGNSLVKLVVKEEFLNKPLVIKTDPFRLQQIMSNLIGNAFKFTEKGTVEFGYNLQHTNQQNTILFYVKDTGIGLMTEQTLTIFNRFTRIEDNLKKIYRGAGLGLAITKNLVEMMGGKIWVESEINKGSAFYFTLPYKFIDSEVKKQPISVIAPSKFRWNEKCILVAEDEESNYKFLEMIIRKTNAELLWAKTGKQALEICKGDYAIDLVLMDIKMPEMDGVEAIKEIRKFKKKIPIIVQTAYAMPEDKTLCMKAGANDFITKPIGTEKLLSIMNKFLSS